MHQPSCLGKLSGSRHTRITQQEGPLILRLRCLFSLFPEDDPVILDSSSFEFLYSMASSNSSPNTMKELLQTSSFSQESLHAASRFKNARLWAPFPSWLHLLRAPTVLLLGNTQHRSHFWRIHGEPPQHFLVHICLQLILDLIIWRRRIIVFYV